MHCLHAYSLHSRYRLDYHSCQHESWQITNQHATGGCEFCLSRSEMAPTNAHQWCIVLSTNIPPAYKRSNVKITICGSSTLTTRFIKYMGWSCSVDLFFVLFYFFASERKRIIHGHREVTYNDVSIPIKSGAVKSSQATRGFMHV